MKEDDEVDEVNAGDEIDEVNEVNEVNPEEVNKDMEVVANQGDEEKKEILPAPTNHSDNEADRNVEERENLPRPDEEDADSEATNEENLPELDQHPSRSSSMSSLQGPVEDNLPPDEDIITHSNDPAGCDLNLVETAEEIEERKRKKREAKRKAKMEALPAQPSMEPREVTVQPMADTLKLQTPMSR